MESLITHSGTMMRAAEHQTVNHPSDSVFTLLVTDVTNSDDNKIRGVEIKMKSRFKSLFQFNFYFNRLIEAKLSKYGDDHL